MKTKHLLISIIVLVASTLHSVEAQVADYGKANGVFSFENDTEGFVSVKGSKTTISNEHAKLGSKSLEWTWNKKGAAIKVDAPVPFLSENPDPKETSVSSFVFWIYSPERLDGELRFSFMKDGRECCHFDYTLGFEGWRGAWVAFARDMEGTPEPDMDQVVISASGNMKKGRLFFDGIITASFQDVRYHTADWQARFINKETTSFWLTLNQFYDTELDIPVNSVISNSEIKDLKTIEERFITLSTEGVKPWDIGKIRETYNSYNITRNPDGTINGKPIWFVRYSETYLNQGIPDAKQTFTEYGQLLQSLNDKMLNIAVSYMNETDPATRKEIADIYVSLTRHLLDQGFAAGSGQGTLHHLGYSMRNFYTGPVIMKDVLKEAGLADDMQSAMEWFCGVGEVKAAPKILGMDIDAFNTSLMGRFASVLMLEDTPYKQAYMKALSRWVDNGFKYTEGLRPSFKREGTVVHHRKCYPEYAVGGFKGSVNAIWMLAGTSFAISEESHEIQKKALLTMRFFSNTKNFPLALSGRHPDGTRSLITSQYARLADAGSPDGKYIIDTELASAYLRLAGTGGDWGKKFTDAGIRPESAPAGGLNLAYNCSLAYRQEDWLLTFAGHSRYLWAAETYKGENHYGRYLTHGSMQFLNEGGSFESGFRLEGWDWCHIPGTTAAELPMKEMKADVLNVDEFSGYEEMLLSDEWFAGGVTFGKEAAMYSMKLHEHDKYNGSLRANKSYFAFGNRIVCLGSDLENKLEGAGLHTTLFQNSVPQSDEIVTIYDGAVTSITDCLGNAYIVRDARIRFSSGLQHSLHEETDKATEGYFEKAYIDHGTICSDDIADCDDDYEYMVIIGASDAETEKYVDEKPYEVTRCDNVAHIVKDKKSGITGCAAFQETSVDDLIISTTPSLMMYRLEGDDLHLSATVPDLALYQGASDEVYDEYGNRKERSVYGRSWIDNPSHETGLKIKFSGTWELVETNNGCNVEVISGEQTTLKFSVRESSLNEVILKRK